MNKLILLMALVSSGAVADGHIYQPVYQDRYNNYNSQRIITIDPVQQRMIQLQQERQYRSIEDNAVRKGLKDAWRGDR